VRRKGRPPHRPARESAFWSNPHQIVPSSVRLLCPQYIASIPSPRIAARPAHTAWPLILRAARQAGGSSRSRTKSSLPAPMEPSETPIGSSHRRSPVPTLTGDVGGASRPASRRPEGRVHRMLCGPGRARVGRRVAPRAQGHQKRAQGSEMARACDQAQTSPKE